MKRKMDQLNYFCTVKCMFDGLLLDALQLPGSRLVIKQVPGNKKKKKRNNHSIISFLAISQP